MGRPHPVTRSPDSPSSETSSGISGHRPNIVRTSSGHFRAFPGIFGHERSSYAILSVAGSRAVRSVAGSRAVRSVAAGMARRRIACRQTRRVPYRLSPDRVPYGPLRRDSPSPDRVPYRPSLNDVSSCAVLSVAGSRLVTSRPPSATSCLCDAHGRVRRRPVVCHAPAQQCL